MRSGFVSMTCAGLMILSATTFSALAQDGSAVMVHRDDDSGTTRVMHFTMPNLEALRAPDFQPRDRPIFNERLVLSDPQSEVIGKLIEAYIKDFQALTKDLATVAGPNAEFSAEAIDDGNQQPDAPRKRMGGGGPGAPGANFADIEPLLPPGSSIGISVGLSMNQTDGADVEGAPPTPPTPQAQVQVSVDTPGGEEIPQDVIDKIQQRANEVAKQVVEQFQAQQEAKAAGKPMPDAPKGTAVQMLDADNLEAHQAELQAKIEDFLKAKARLRAEFVTNAQANLAEPQVVRWPALERALTRARSLPKGRIAGESTDLLKVLADSKPTESQFATLAPHTEAYELALDSALKQRDEFLADANQRIDQAIGEQKPDKAISIADRAADVRVAVRTVNVQAMEQFAQALGADGGPAFRAAALKAFYPSVYRQTRGQKAFAAIEKMDGVPADAAATLADLRRAYDSELVTANDHLRQTIDREQPKERMRGLENLKRTMQGENDVNPEEPFAERDRPEDPIKEAMERRADLDDRYLKNVAALLPADKAAELPKPRTRKGPLVIRSGTGN